MILPPCYASMIGDIQFINSQLEQERADAEVVGLAADADGYADYYDDGDDAYLIDSGGQSSSGGGWTLSEQILLLTVLALFGVLTVAGNVLVVLCVTLERSLRTVSNYYLASLSCADLIVGVFMMPLAAYLEIFDSKWPFGPVLCNLWLAADVTASTASILGLIAIAYNRYLAIVKPFAYGTIQKNPYLAFWAPMVTIWLVSAGIASPIVFGVNTVQNESRGLCTLANLHYLLYSSIFSFFIPSAIMVILYVAIFRALAKRAQRTFARRNRSSGYFRHLTKITNIRQRSQSTPTVVAIGNHGGSKRKRLDSACQAGHSSPRTSLENNRERGSPKRTLLKKASVKRCVYDDASGVYLGEVASLPSLLMPKHVADELTKSDSQLKGSSDSHFDSGSLEDSGANQSSPESGQQTPNHKRSQLAVEKNDTNDSHARLSDTTNPRKPSERRRGHRFGDRLSKSSISKERKTTTMLVIVLVLFFVCWCPFFSSNVINAFCVIFNQKCSVPDTWSRVFIWLGYCNSTMNPVVYAIFNLEFRRTLRRLLFGKGS